MRKLPLLTDSLGLEGSDLGWKALNPRNFKEKSYIVEDLAIGLSQPSGNNQTLLVSGQTNGTNTVRKSTKRTSEKHQTLEILELFPREKSQTMTSSALAGLASRLASLEEGRDLRTLEGLSFLKSLGFSETKDPDIYYSKMSKVYLVTKREKLSRQYLGFLPTWGIDVNGRYLTAGISVFPRTGSGCSLSDILEENPGNKYFLSKKSMEYLARRMDDHPAGTKLLAQ